MIHAIVFANRERGNQLYERTPEFPDDAASDILELCNSLRTSGSVCETAPVLRYQPLGKYYLLSVIQRMKLGGGAEIRAHAICVSFLMDGRAAERFFRIPFPIAAQAATETAQKLLTYRNTFLPREICGRLLQPQAENTPLLLSETPLPILMAGASYALDPQLTKQLFLQSSRPAVDELHNLLLVLPPPLRKEISFHTGCISAGECQNLGICYCQEGTLKNMLASDFAGGPPTTKFWYSSVPDARINKVDDQVQALTNRLLQIPKRIPLYRLLRDAVTDWTVYRELSLLMPGPVSLKDVLVRLPEASVIQIIQSGRATEEQLVSLKQASRIGSPIRKAAKAAQKERNHTP